MSEALRPGSTRTVRIVVVDDHPLVRESITFFLSKETDLEVVGACETADQCLAMAPKADPHVILMDIEMPGSSAFQVARELRRQGHAARFIFLSAFLTDSY